MIDVHEIPEQQLLSHLLTKAKLMAQHNPLFRQTLRF